MTKRVVIFAGYNSKSRIEDYVLYYLKGLREIADTLIYVADNEASDIYKSQLEGIADNIILERHGEYDFGSW
ncbi:MAG: glycosyl transferase family 1, partial [Alphaproteobacteria bacterium]|nr:glycosyl transferase family 1 [Alphaproteobacteria bacterium]